MIDPNAKRIQRKPRKGDRIGFGTFVSRPHPDPEVHEATGLMMAFVVEPTAARFTVVRTPEPGDNLCWIREDGKDEAQPFIWNHRDGRNLLARIFDVDDERGV